MASSEILTPAVFARLLAPFDLAGRVVALAVSGGPDSMAMTWLAREVLGAGSLRAFIVEHGLRDCSAAEATGVRATLEKMGIQTRILPWRHDKIESRVHVLARRARYDLLCEACREAGARDLLLAHHADDQAETILMRLAKGSGLAGLAGMAPARKHDDIRLIRPLLSVRKSQLEATCRAHDVPFVRDQSNNSDHYARGRLRAVTESLAQEGLTHERLLDLGARARDVTEMMEHFARIFVKENVTLHEGGFVSMDRAAFLAAPRALGLHLLALILQSLCRRDFAPKREALLRLWEFLGKDEDHTTSTTLHHCLVQKQKEKIVLMREPSSVTEVLFPRAGETVLWDGRWRVVCPVEEGLMLKALGHPPHAVIDRIAPLLRKKIPGGRARAGLPSLWHNNELVGMPALSCDFGALAEILAPCERG